MSSVPSDRQYTKTHEWLKPESDGSVSVGISDYAQGSLGDITYVQLPKVGAVLQAGEAFGVLESVKAASDLYVPVAGTVLAVNQALESEPELVNRSPYEEGWMIRLQPAGAAEGLLSADDYSATIT